MARDDAHHRVEAATHSGGDNARWGRRPNSDVDLAVGAVVRIRPVADVVGPRLVDTAARGGGVPMDGLGRPILGFLFFY